MTHPELEILAHFEPEQSWTLEAGDMLYLPPGISHHGVALEDNLTYSIGFRAPTERDLVTGFVDYLATAKLSDNRYHDADLSVPANSGEIDSAALRRVREVIERVPTTGHDIARWFGRFVTEPKSLDEAQALEKEVTVEEFARMFHDQETLRRNELTRMAFVEQVDCVLLFVGGEVEQFNRSMAEAIRLLCNQRVHYLDTWSELLECEEPRALLLRLFNEGHLYFEDE